MKLSFSQMNALGEVLSLTTVVASILTHPVELFTQTSEKLVPSLSSTSTALVRKPEHHLSKARGNQPTDSRVDFPSQNQQLIAEYNASSGKEIQLGKELTELLKTPESKRTSAQQQRITLLVELQQQIRQQFNHFIRTDAIKELVQQLNETSQGQNLPLSNLNTLRNNLQPDDVLLYPLILPDQLKLVVVTFDSPPIYRSVPVKRDDLNQAIAEFRRALENPTIDAQITAQHLYNWLIKPIESDLTQAQAKTIIYAPDGQLRYVPLAALHDGKQWLVQRFSIYNITAATIHDLNTKRQNQQHVLAGALTQGRYTFNVDSRQFYFAGLPFAGTEVENLAVTVPNTTKLLDDAFSREATVSKMRDYNVVHLATHAMFVPGQPEDSFIVFGNGDRVTLRDVETWNLPNVDLVVLSACQTGVGGFFGTGEEILGFGYLMQQAGAKAVMASLWAVDDAGTQSLMDAFYKALVQGNLTKAQALRQAQIALISSDSKALGQQRGIILAQQGVHNSLPKEATVRFEHPYYWAPFILIGNGL